MRLHVLITEATPAQLAKKMPDQLVARWSEDTGEDISASQVMDELTKFLPKSNINTYVEWFTKLFLNKQIKLHSPSEIILNNGKVESAEDVREVLTVHNNSAENDFRDPMKFHTYELLYRHIKHKLDAHLEKKKNNKNNREVWANKGKKGSGAEIEEWIPKEMYRANSVKAAYALGASTWCVSNRGNPESARSSHCRVYTNNWETPFLVVIDDYYGKLGIFPTKHGGNFVDDTNVELEDDQIRYYLEENPDVYEHIKPYMDDDHPWHPVEEGSPGEALNYLRNNLDDEDDELDYYYTNLGKSPELTIKFVADVYNAERNASLEKEFLKHAKPEHIMDYIDGMDIEERWKEAEPIVKQDKIYWRKYLEHLDKHGITDDVESSVKTAYHPDPQTQFKFSEDFTQMYGEFLIEHC